MTEIIRAASGGGRHRAEAFAVLTGNGVAVYLSGGDTPHVGASALACPRESLKRDGSASATASVLCVTGHKDDIPARECALRIASACGITASVTAGLHIDNPAEADFAALLGNVRAVTEELVRTITAALAA